MKTKNVILLLSSLAFLAACGSNTNPPLVVGKKRTNAIKEQAEAESKTSSTSASTSTSSADQTKKAMTLSAKRTVELSEDFSNLEEVKSELNSFKVEAELEKMLDVNAVLKCFKVKNEEKVNFEEQVVHIGYTRISLDVALEKDESKIDLNCQILNKKKEIAAAQITLFKSVVVEKSTDFKDLLLEKGVDAYEVDRLIIADRGEILFGSEDVTLNANELFADKGVIKTFESSEALNATPGLAGKNGAKLTFNVKKSSGILNAVMIGKDGDKQTTRGAKGLPGAKGTSAVADIVKEYEECTEGGPGPGHRQPYCRIITEVITQGKAAGKGGDGAKGAKGEKGNTGGSSGLLNYTTQTASKSFDLKIESAAGKGGAGGMGGEGGAAGMGGDAAGKYKAGAMGSVGPSGDQGLIGEAGILEKSCVKKLSESTNCLTKI